MCENRTYKARVHTNVDEDNYVIIKEVGEHNHTTTASSVSAKCASNQIKDKALGTQDSSRTLIATELKNLHECAIAELPCPSNISRNIRRWRQKENKSPPIPQVRHGYLIPEDYAKLSTGSLFLQYDSGEDDLDRILVFASADGLSDLKKFKVRADLVQNHEPDRIVVDFEKAVINSLKAVFQETEVSCCLFHLSQNVYKHTVQAGYKERYHQDDEFSLKVRCFPALAFLPPNDVLSGFEELIDDNEIPEEIVSYFSTNYIGDERGRGSRRRRLEPLFPIQLWNVYQSTVNEMPRTNNNLEGFHSSLRTSVTSSHPNIWKLIDALKNEEGRTSENKNHTSKLRQSTFKEKKV
ncbi:uncharacterized protein [Macrobrachium rosenbergii]|uniref:uncharacterized protein n=1 Tax=Macrobrachium rosenbergii TaxID=79674 RepID=UPI0034D3F08B